MSGPYVETTEDKKSINIKMVVKFGTAVIMRFTLHSASDKMLNIFWTTENGFYSVFIALLLTHSLTNFFFSLSCTLTQFNRFYVHFFFRQIFCLFWFWSDISMFLTAFQIAWSFIFPIRSCEFLLSKFGLFLMSCLFFFLISCCKKNYNSKML